MTKATMIQKIENLKNGTGISTYTTKDGYVTKDAYRTMTLTDAGILSEAWTTPIAYEAVTHVEGRKDWGKKFIVITLANGAEIDIKRD